MVMVMFMMVVMADWQRTAELIQRSRQRVIDTDHSLGRSEDVLFHSARLLCPAAGRVSCGQ